MKKKKADPVYVIKCGGNFYRNDAFKCTDHFTPLLSEATKYQCKGTANDVLRYLKAHAPSSVLAGACVV